MRTLLPEHWRAYLSENVLLVVAIGLSVLVGLVSLLSFVTGVAPAVRARNEVADELAGARQQLAQKQAAQAVNPADLQRQIVEAQTVLTNSQGLFLPDAQASQIVDAMYARAAAGGVAIVDFQASVAATPPDQPRYAVTTARVQVQGTPYDLVHYLSDLTEITTKGVIVNSLVISSSQALGNLSLELTFYTSPSARPQTVTAPPVRAPAPVVPAATPLPPAAVVPPVTVTPAPLPAELQQSFDALWRAQNWPDAIRAVEAALSIYPDHPELRLRLYAAHVNYGYWLQSRGRVEDAIHEFSVALQVKPDGAEALNALAQLVPTPTPGP